MSNLLSFNELQALIINYLNKGNKLSIQQVSSKINSPSFSFNLDVSNCVPLYNGIQFHLGGGYIDLTFEENPFSEHFDGFLEEKTFNIDLKYDDDKPKGYWLHIGEVNLFFYGEKIMDILKNIKLETKEYNKNKLLQHTFKSETNKDLDKETIDAIDNMLEK